jgi:hypothetical protein
MMQALKVSSARWHNQLRLLASILLIALNAGNIL